VEGPKFISNTEKISKGRERGRREETCIGVGKNEWKRKEGWKKEREGGMKKRKGGS
jgi:hypothetical protein